jgi:hypothetical protein
MTLSGLLVNLLWPLLEMRRKLVGAYREENAIREMVSKARLSGY